MSNNPFFSIFSTLWRGLQGHDGLSADASTLGNTGTLFQAGCPAVNVDGTPMLDGAVDVLGKLYGDSGSSSTDSHDIFGNGLHGSDW
ncbi:MAG: hypothetical protein KGZ67_04875 [Hydrogenophaga sp.]|jgi:hypothetical protein|nr:hypothetical protein [Hydrogenophaga sp.]